MRKFVGTPDDENEALKEIAKAIQVILREDKKLTVKTKGRLSRIKYNLRLLAGDFDYYTPPSDCIFD